MTSTMTRSVLALSLGFAMSGVVLAQEGPAPNMSFFITSAGPGDGGNLGGLSGADAHCQSLAAAVGGGDKTWRAYLSAAGENGGPGYPRARPGRRRALVQLQRPASRRKRGRSA